MNDHAVVWTDLRVVITGASSGIGAAAAARLISLGAQVCNLDRVEAAAGATEMRTIAVDVTDGRAVKQAVGAAAVR